MNILKKEIIIYILNHDDIFTHNLDYQMDSVNFWISPKKGNITIMITYLVSNNKYTMLSYNINIRDYMKFIRKRKLSNIAQ